MKWRCCVAISLSLVCCSWTWEAVLSKYRVLMASENFALSLQNYTLKSGCGTESSELPLNLALLGRLTGGADLWWPGEDA